VQTGEALSAVSKALLVARAGRSLERTAHSSQHGTQPSILNFQAGNVAGHTTTATINQP